MARIWIRVLAILALLYLGHASPVPAIDAEQEIAPAAEGPLAQLSQPGTTTSPTRKRVTWADLVEQPAIPAAGSSQPARLRPVVENTLGRVGSSADDPINHNVYWGRDGRPYASRDAASATYPEGFGSRPLASRPQAASNGVPYAGSAREIYRGPEPIATTYFVNGKAYTTYQEAIQGEQAMRPQHLVGSPPSERFTKGKPAVTKDSFWGSWFPKWRSSSEPASLLQSQQTKMSTNLPKLDGKPIMKLSGDPKLAKTGLGKLASERDNLIVDRGNLGVQSVDRTLGGHVATNLVDANTLQRISRSQAQAPPKGWWQRLAEGARSMVGKLSSAASPARYIRGR